MVLKKSNSRLNSGATQRAVTHAGINKLENVHFNLSYPPYIPNVENYFLVTTDVNMKHQESQNRLHACLEEMYNYLGFDIPDLSHTFNQNLPRRSLLPNSVKHINECSLDRNNMWLLPERITQMQADTDFLSRLNQNLQVRFHKIVNSMITTSSINRFKSMRTKTVAASEIIAKSSDCLTQQPRSQSPRPRRRQACHNRGVQRTHLFSRQKKNCHDIKHSEEAGTEDQVGHLDVYLFAPCRIEARSAYYRVEKKFAKRTNTSRLKSSTKMNGRSKGRFPCRQGYCSRDLADDTMYGIEEVYEDSADSTVFDDKEEGNTSDLSKRRELNYDIINLITVRRRRLKRNRNKTATGNEQDLNGCAPLINKIRHPKGSFVLVPKDECRLEDEPLEGVATSSHQQDNSDIAQNESWSENTVGIEVHKNERAFELEDIHNFYSGFVEVNLAFSEDHKKWISPKQETRDTGLLVDEKYSVTFGNSFPECFVVDCRPDKIHTKDHHWRVIVGKRRESQSDIWIVSIQDQWQTSTQTKQFLQNFINHNQDKRIYLSELIYWATALESRETTITSSDRTSELVREEKWMSSSLVWRNMPLKIATSTESFTVEEVANKLNSESIMDRTVLRKQSVIVELSDDSYVTPCGVCFMEFDHSNLATSSVVLLPCSHTYCVNCWRSHVQHCIRNGANRITCMSPNCTNLMDMATVSSMLPYTLVHQWQVQVTNRRIDCSPFCRWCPNVGCDKVAVSRNETLKQQFGKVITCTCLQCWCSGCQEDPHWPASCDQIAAYRKLLAKSDKTVTFSKRDVTLEVEIKRCPNCQYPIEKNAGCPTMTCSMCNHIFCWACLKPSHTHGRCNDKNVETISYHLNNKLEIQGPLTWYPYCLKLRREIKNIQKTKNWLRRLHKKATCHRLMSLPVHMTNKATQIATSRAEECVLFFMQAYTLQESMHVLIGFAELNERRENRFVAKLALYKMSRLDFILWRLKEAVFEKSLSHLCKIDAVTTHLLRAGRNVIQELAVLAPALQRLSKDIDTTSVGELDPALLIRYK